ncbi:MAG: prepilin-type N-terminal cleavage/methylation domain-containing protein [Lentisphaeraceae bacterium]|nr:prepilin-type N-terminal cleavage/methylation domain-containing protein [Lentisphaeraceae bacterium]
MKKFTLIELLVVVAIIGLLMSILLPSLAKAREAGKSAVCKSNMKQLGIAFELYAGNSDESVTPGGMKFSMAPASFNYPRQDKTTYYSDPALLGQYAGNDMYTGNAWNHIQGRQPVRNSAFSCPSATDENTFGAPPYHTRIGINVRISPVIHVDSDWDKIIKIGTIADPVKLVMFVDHKGARFHPGYGSAPPSHGNPQPLTNDDGGNWSFGVDLSYYNWVKRHKQGTNLGFADGHVSFSRNLQADVADEKYKVVNR